MILVALALAQGLAMEPNGGRLPSQLIASGPAPALRNELMQFGRLVGSWTMCVTQFRPDGSVLKRTAAAWTFGWVLEGRGVQDVFIVPERALLGERQPGEYGTTLRIYDPGIKAWRVTYAGPRQGVFIDFIGKKKGDDVVLEHKGGNGAVDHWIFSDVTTTSFRWRALNSADGGRTWTELQEMVGSPADTAPPTCVERPTPLRFLKPYSGKGPASIRAAKSG